MLYEPNENTELGYGYQNSNGTQISFTYVGPS